METTALPQKDDVKSPATRHAPAIGFVGLGHIGLSRMEMLARISGKSILMATDVIPERLKQAAGVLPDVIIYPSFDDLLAKGKPDAVVISTPNSMHAAHCQRAMEEGIPVFCQKPLGRNTGETSSIIEMAQSRNLLLGIDFTYRYACFSSLKPLLESGEIGKPVAIEMCFHNAYGPDKNWFYHRSSAGGGCVIDLGIHLIDMMLWLLDYPGVEVIASMMSSKGKPLTAEGQEVEDFALALLCAGGNLPVSLTCSWHSSPGAGADFSFHLHGTLGALSFRNKGGSFYDFEAVRLHGDKTIPVSEETGIWGGSAIAHWFRKLGESAAFDPGSIRAVQVAEIVDEIYRKGISH
ncbi:MAG: hypothetical protein ABS46_00770 [Cytophagaceae bacterium SCN 52-12]|nr:MAG: hypothetical protein ABS46_00770 [Cytophagaceae bacterium SCN 52-12]